MQDVEKITLGSGDNKVTIRDGVVTPAPATVDVNGGAGDNIIDGSALGVTTRLLAHAGTGDDTLIGGHGQNVFYFAADELNAGDTVTGYDDSKIRLELTTGGTVAADDFAHVTGVGYIEFSDNATSVTLAENGPHIIDGGKGDDMIDASRVALGRVHFPEPGYISGGVTIDPGYGSDTVIGSAYSDRFDFDKGKFSSGDHVDGGDGQDELYLEAGSVDLSNVRGVEIISFDEGLRTVLVADITATTATGGLSVYGGDGTIDASAVTSPVGVRLFGSLSNDLLQGGAGADTLTGHTSGLDVGDVDTFQFKFRSGGSDRIMDFHTNDHLQFAATAFDYNGAAFDTSVTAPTTATDITGADLVIHNDGGTATVATIKDYLAHATGGSVDEGVFVVSDGKLFHAIDASFTHSQDVFEVASFANNGASAIALASFHFI